MPTSPSNEAYKEWKDDLEVRALQHEDHVKPVPLLALFVGLLLILGRK